MTKAIQRISWYVQPEVIVAQAAVLTLRGWANGRLRYNAQMNQARGQTQRQLYGEIRK